ncbi:hypothetical protein CHS0354_032981 [Potamilus streckersoni]|uniref:Protein SHQ1 homolog n=1 Tax=Potamilus streckersoni TaxID=2493646 RepID=A0AAE0RXC1_9BIVA|nr:hypothetical protein CHS0354_032981 [Potamilus streckersoni]
MLTPAFGLSQNEEYLIINIKAPFSKVADTEIFIEENDFKFYSKPYFLRLKLPGNIVEDGRETAKYDSDNGTFLITVPKETRGQYFEGLDMLTKLLAPKGTTSAQAPLIQILDSDDKVDDEVVQTELEETFDWFIEQIPYVEEETPLGAPKYGFAMQRSGVFNRLQAELSGVIDVKNPDTTPAGVWRKQRKQEEQEKFDQEHYLADLYEDEAIQNLLSYKPPWSAELQQVQRSIAVDDAVILTEEEKEKLRKLPRKEYLIDDKVLPSVYLGLVDIIFAYAYDHRTTEGEKNVESGWTICKLSSTLSWLECFSNLEDVSLSCMRRSLCYPLFRHWGLSQAVLQDVRQIFKLGQKRLLKCLLDIHSIMIDLDCHYILNDLYITDYCVWIQSASKKRIESLSVALEKINVEKDSMGFDIIELETAARLSVEESINDMTHDLSNIDLSKKEENSSAQDSDDNGTSSNSDDGTTSSNSDDGTTSSGDESFDSDDTSTGFDDESTDIDNENIDSDSKDIGKCEVKTCDKYKSEGNVNISVNENYNK